MNFWIGYTSRHPYAFEVCKASLERFGINCYQVPSYFEPNVNTPFTRTRFLVPYLDKIVSSNQWVAYVDDDFLFLEDPNKLLDTVEQMITVYCCKHPTYTSKVKKKSMGKQINYPMKNWSSFMIFNKEMNNPEPPVFNETLQHLHRFDWVLLKDQCIGDMPIEWNWLVGEYEEDKDVKALHYTLGGPWYKKKQHKSNYNDIWIEHAKSFNIKW